MQHPFDLVVSVQRQLQGVLAGHAFNLFDSPERFALGIAVAVALVLVHALTPGHGKSVIFSYFLGQRGSVVGGMRIAATAAATHGTIAVLLVLVLGRVLSPLGRPIGVAAWLEVVSGVIVAALGALYVVLALRGLRHVDCHTHDVPASRPLLAVAIWPSALPLTIIVVGAAAAQGAVGAGIALAAGTSLGAAVTLGCFGLLGLALRSGGLVLAGPRFGRFASALGWLEIVASSLILLLGLLMLSASVARLR